MLAIARSMVADAPSPIAPTQITALTPMMMPREVRPERSLFRASALSAIAGSRKSLIGAESTLASYRAKMNPR
jgi:hypothetical protein